MTLKELRKYCSYHCKDGRNTQKMRDDCRNKTPCREMRSKLDENGFNKMMREAKMHPTFRTELFKLWFEDNYGVEPKVHTGIGYTSEALNLGVYKAVRDAAKNAFLYAYQSACGPCEKKEKEKPKVSGRQEEVLEYLRGKGWTSPTVIGGAVWGGRHHSASAGPVCIRLVEKGLLSRNKRGHYRIKESEVGGE